MPHRPDGPIEVFTRLWDLTRHAFRKESFDAFRADLAHNAEEFEIRTHPDFERLKALGSAWTGFGTGLDSGLGLFFRNSSQIPQLPPIAQDIPYHPLGSLDLGSIRPGLPDFQHCRPAPGANISWSGSACHAPDCFGNGTLGAFLRDDQGAIWLLSANHVISRNNKCEQNTVAMNACSVVSRQTIGVPIHDFRRHDASPNKADAAIGRWDADAAPQAWVDGLPPLTPSILAPQEAQGLMVTKIGLPTDRTHGRVAYVNARVAVDMSPDLPFSCVEFAGQLLIEDVPELERPFSHQGDSGSLVVCETLQESQPLGLLIANNAEREGKRAPAVPYSVVTPLGTVLQALRGVTGRTYEVMT